MNAMSRNQLGYRKPLSETFWNNVIKTETCWLWNKTYCRSHYGITTKRLPDGSRVGLGAHRRSWEIHFGEIPNGLKVLHKCDVKRCVNPDHLFLGTQKDNMVDKNKKGRQAKGEKNGWSKMTTAKVLKMRKLKAMGLSTLECAERFGLTRSGAYDIISRKNWKHL